ncbi:MAG: hypothetical protein V4726_08220 [Verrucomicrobiota bacterium]
MKTTSRLAALLILAAGALMASGCACSSCCAGPGAAAPVKEAKKA